MASDPKITLAEARVLSRLDDAQVGHLFRVVLQLEASGPYWPESDAALAPSDAAMLWFAHVLADVGLGTPEQRDLILADCYEHVSSLDDALAAIDLGAAAPGMFAPVRIADRRYVDHPGRRSDYIDLHAGRPVKLKAQAVIETIVYDVVSIYFVNAGKVVRSRRRRPKTGGA